jgi:hypothetical protein
MALLTILLVVALALALVLHASGRVSRLAWEIVVTLVLILMLVASEL